MACLQIIIQLLIRLLASFCIYGGKISHSEFESKLKDWIKRYLIETWHRLFQGCFKSYRIGFRVAIWLDFGQLSSYLFVYWRLFRVTISKCNMLFDTNWRIESRDILFKLTTGYLKSISSHIEYFLGWLYGLILNNYLVTYSFIDVFWSCGMKSYMEFDTNWRIQLWDVLFKLTTGYLKSISSHIE